jgi:3-oxoadipate enol-lactonase
MADQSDAVVAAALTLGSVTLPPRPEFTADLRRRLHRRLGFALPAGVVPMRKAVGLEYEVGGRPGGEAVLFIHAGTATAYSPLMGEPALAGHYRLVRVHRRGYAGSDGFDGPVTIDVLVHDALALLEHLAIERAHVVGHSGSGVVALQLALDAPERVRTLALEEPALVQLDERWRRAAREATAAPRALARAGNARGAVEMWMNGIARGWRTDLERAVPGGPQQTIDDAATFMAEVEAVDAWEFDRSRTEAMTVPVLFVVAAGSPYRAAARRFQTHVPHTEIVTIPDATHMLHTDQPALVAAELGSFFARHIDHA